MSGGAPWLSRQRKMDLTGIAELVGLKDYDDLKKSELEVALDKHLQEHESTLSKNPKFAKYYERTSSPVKRELATGAALAMNELEAKPVKPRQRRVTKVADEIGTDESSPEERTTSRTALATRTPRSILQSASNVPLPPSPAVIANAVDRRATDLKRRGVKVWKKSGVTERAHGLRELLSSVASIETIVLLIEAYGLRSEVLPSRYAFTIPGVALLRTPDWPVSIPDLFLLLTSSFWGPTSLWLFTSLFVPLAFAYFFNLTLKAKTATRSHVSSYKFDPLTFNVAKALITYLVYRQNVRFGIASSQAIYRIIMSVPGGVDGILIGAGIGILVSLYDAVLKK